MYAVTQPANPTDTATGIANIYLFSILGTNPASITADITSSYYAICLALNVLLTLMIITKLTLHRRNLQHAIGTSNAITGVYTTIVVMLVESYALYATTLLSYILTWALKSAGVYLTSKIQGNVTVCAVFHFPHTQGLE